jgi:type III pantothenate kinase
MLLVVDMGNTNTVFGIFESGKLLYSSRIATSANRTADETGMFIYSIFSYHKLDAALLEDAIISSVVPNGLPSLAHGIKKYFMVTPIIVNYKMVGDIGLPESVAAQIGTDRLVNNVAALNLYGGPCLVADYGTATTYDVVGPNGEFVTGITAPGIRVSADALYKNAALLGTVELALPPSAIATNTVESLQAGILLGRIGETEYLVKRLRAETGYTNMRVIATGGLARVITQGTDIIEVYNPTLTMEGLQMVYSKTRHNPLC